MYVYAADLWCDDCATDIVADLEARHVEDTGDSGDFPQGPYDDSEESDCPQHCGGCSTFLENDLTTEGQRCVAGKLVVWKGDPDVLALWAEYYSALYGWVDVASLDDEDREALAKFATDFHGDDVYALEGFEEAYRGTWRSEVEYAENLADDLGYLREMPENLRGYFDAEAFARDLFISDMWGANTVHGVAVFRAS